MNHNIVEPFEDTNGKLVVNVHGKQITVEDAIASGICSMDKAGVVRVEAGGQPDREPGQSELHSETVLNGKVVVTVASCVDH